MSGRDVPDRCPGAVQVHPAADGGLARVRLPGGVLRPGRLDVLRTAAAELADPVLELTSRGNVQVRAVRAGAEAELGERLARAGLLPSQTHERVRNIVASPLSGRDGAGRCDVRAVLAEFDAGLCADPGLAGLPGRFLVTLDDGRGDVTALGGDVGLHGDRLLLAGAATTARCTAGTAAELLLAATRAFQQERLASAPHAWRLAELPGGPVRVAARLGVALDDTATPAPGPRPRVGVLEQADGRVALHLVVPLGLLTPEQAQALCATGGETIVTPWRTVVVPDVAVVEAVGTLELLTRAGLVDDPASPWAGVTACAGRPGCAKALADVRSDARASVTRSAWKTPGDLPVHWVGCERRCGAPKGRHVEMLATADGYRTVTL